MWCGDIVLVGNKVGTVIGMHNDCVTLALCDGTTTPVYKDQIGVVVTSAQDLVKQFEEQICSQVQ